MRLGLAAFSVVGLILGGAASGQESPIRLQPEFTFKSVTPPAPGEAPASLPQIDPNAPRLDPVYADPATTPEPSSDVSGPELPSPSGMEWFWATVPSQQTAEGAARFQSAMAQLNDPPDGTSVRTPRLQSLQDIASAHGRTILAETVGTSVSPALVLAVISVESAGQVEARSSAGAEGLMQLMPATADRFGVSERSNPEQNIKGGVAYLDWLLGHFDNDAVLALAGYNAGEGSVARYAGVPPFPETRAYIPKVLAAWQVAKGLCLTRPDLITDPCVFNVNGI